jgi:hypothetical protein
MSLCRNGIGNAYGRAQIGQSPEDYNQVGAAQSFMTPGGGSVYITDAANGGSQVPYSTPSAGVQMYPPGASPSNYGYGGYGYGYGSPCPDGYIADAYGNCYNLGYSQPGMAYGPLQSLGPQCPPCPSCPSCAAPARPRVVMRRR